MSTLTIEEFWAEAERSRKYVEKFAVKALRLSPPDAEDLASQAIVQAAQFEQKVGSPGFKGDIKFSSYLTKIASNVYFDNRRKKEAKTIFYSLDGDKNPAHEITTAAAQHELIMRSILSRKVRAAIVSLAPSQRMSLELELNDYRRTEAADALGIERGTFRSNRYRALANLRKQHPELRELLPTTGRSSRKHNPALPQ